MLTDNNLEWLQIHCGWDWDVRRLKLMLRESCHCEWSARGGGDQDDLSWSPRRPDQRTEPW